jgi:hypothetical protein
MMADQSATERAEMMAQMAPHPSVTTEILLGGGPGFDGSRLVGDPPVAYLDDTEAPAYVLTDAKRGVAIGLKRDRTPPDDDRGTVVLVTGRRTLCLVGTRPDDTVVEIPHASVADVEYHTGFLANRLEIRTPDRIYHCWLDRGTDEDLLEQTTEYIRQRLAESADGDADTAASGLTYRGEPLPGHTAHDAPVATDGEGSSGDGPEETEEDGDTDDTVMYRGQPVDQSYLE